MNVLITILWVTSLFPAGQWESAKRDTLLFKNVPDSLQYHRITPAEPNMQPSLYNLPATASRSDSMEVVIPDTVYVWKYAPSPGTAVAESDSTLRWLGYLNLADRFYREKGAQTYRQGTVGRIDGLEIHTYQAPDIKLTMEGLNLNSPLNGTANWNRIAIHKIAEMTERDYGAEYQADIRLRDYYLIEPRTYLNFDESAYNFRSLDFVFSQNFRKNTNVEFSFWDRRDGGGYTRQEVQGRQAAVKVYHQLSHKYLVKAGYINNAMERQEPFGYVLTDPLHFNFNRFIESPLEGSAVANQTSSDVYLQLHQRRDTTATVDRILGVHLQTDKWGASYSADTLSVSFTNLELYGRQSFSRGGTELRADGRLFLLNETSGGNLARTSWAGAAAEVAAEQQLGELFEAGVQASYTFWNDNRFTSALSGRLDFRPGSQIQAAVFGGISVRAADIQALYWQSGEFTGNENLGAVTSSFAGAEMTKGIGSYLTAGVRGDLRLTNNAIFITADSSFASVDPYTTLSATGWIGFDSPVFEGELSGNWRNYQSDSVLSVNHFLNNQPGRASLKASLFWKNYVFNRAAYVKAGLIGHFLPQGYHAAEYYPELNRWQYGTQTHLNPSHTRLDGEVSARVRWFMVLLRWENVLDRVNQLGYFETVGYPMPERRFVFGLRVLFTN